MAERLRRDHGIDHELANVFTFPPSLSATSAKETA
jgi:hypothetical protein